MIIFLREMKRNRKTFIIWMIIMIALFSYMIALYPVIADQAKVMEDFMKQMPKSLLSAFNFDKLSFSNIIEYFGTEPYIFLVLLGGIYAMILAAGILSKEESDKTVEFLLSKPVTRNTVITNKILSVLVYIILFNLTVFIVNVIMISLFAKGNYDFGTFLLLSVAPIPVEIAFASVGLLISVFIVKAKSVLPLSIGIVVGSYLINILAGLSDKTQDLKYLSFFKYVDAADLIQTHSIKGIYLVILFMVTAVCVALTYVLYNRKNITA